MPTNHGETLHDRYEREHRSELEIAGRMTPDDVYGLIQSLHNARAELAALRAENERLTREQGEGTTSNKYRAELYDEVWQRAREMGFENVTMALSELAALKAVPDGVRRDAERYRWLIDSGNDTYSMFVEAEDKAALDAAIDAALAAHKAGGGDHE